MKSLFVLGLPNRVNDGAFLPTETLYDRVGHNSGNLAFQFAVASHFGNSAKVVGWGADPKIINTMGDIGVLPAANQFGAHVDYTKLGERFSELTCRIVMIGLGAQSDVDGKIPEVPEGTVNWVREIAKRSPEGVPNISTRGAFTKKVLEHFGFEGNVVALGCPSLFINPDPDLGQKIASNLRTFKRIAVPAGHQNWKHLRHIEASLARIMTATDGSYVGQHALPMMQLTRGEARHMDEADLRACRDYACPEMDLEEFTRWSERHGNLFFDVQSWMEHYRRFDLVIGARIHGVMLALQAGIPGVVVAHDSRTLELCQTMMVPYVLAKDVQQGITREQLPDLFKFDAKAFDANRQSLARSYVEFLESNELKPIGWLKNIGAAR